MRSLSVTPKQQEAFVLANSLLLISSYGVIQEVMQYVRVIESIYRNCKMIEDLQLSDKDEQVIMLQEEIAELMKTLPQYHLLFLSD